MVEQPEVLATAAVFVPGSSSIFRYPTGSSRFDGCFFEFVEAGDTITHRPGAGSTNLDGVTWDVDYWVIFCPPDTLNAYTLYPDGDPPPADVVADLIQDAYERTPVVAFNPISSPPGDQDIPLITQMTTFLWVDETVWATPVSAVASVPGFSVETTAVADTTRWSGGDTPAACGEDDMHPYVFGIGGDDAQTSNCTMIYKQSTALGDHTVDLEVDWTVTLTCSIPSVCGGPLPSLTTRSTRPVIVGEIQGVVVSPVD